MDPIDQLPARVKYYLLDFKDQNRDDFCKMYGFVKLRSLTSTQLHAYFVFATAQDKKSISKHF